jgi:exosortase
MSELKSLPATLAKPVVKESPRAVPLPYSALLWYAAILGVIFGPVLAAMAYQWQTDEDMGHGLFVPLIAGYILWERREEWLHGPIAWDRSGLVLVGVGTIVLWLGTLGSELFLQRSAFLITIVGICLFYRGGRVVWMMSLPLLLLVFMIPIPGILYKQITFPLQLLASRLAETTLETLGYMVLREGNVLELAGQQLSVIEACSGLRALHSLSFFSLTYAYLFYPSPWMRWFLLACTAPVAIVANTGRVVLTGVIGEYDQELASGIYHTVSGWSLFVIAIGLLIIIQKTAAKVSERRSKQEWQTDSSGS